MHPKIGLEIIRNSRNETKNKIKNDKSLTQEQKDKLLFVFDNNTKFAFEDFNYNQCQENEIENLYLKALEDKELLKKMYNDIKQGN